MGPAASRCAPQPFFVMTPTQQVSAPGTNHPMWLQALYLSLAIAGAVLTWQANLEFIRQSGAAFDLSLFVQQASANPAARSLSWDLAVGATAVTIWMVRESRRLGIRGLGWVLLSCVTIAFACGAPLFLFLRERRLQELARQSGD
jgi:hypothetical protein